MSERALALSKNGCQRMSAPTTSRVTNRCGRERSPIVAGADAARQGILASEIGEAIDDLAAFMVGSIEEAAERKAHAEQDDDGQAGAGGCRGLGNAEEDALEDEEDKRR